MTSPNLIVPVPDEYLVGATVGWLFTGWIMFAAFAFLAYGCYRIVAHRDYLPALMWVGGLVCSFVEPMGDLVGHLWYPPDLPVTLYNAYGVDIPLLIPLAYAFLIAGGGYLAYRRILVHGATLKSMYVTVLIIGVTDFILEIPGTAFGAHHYYGEQPFKVLNFPLHWTWLNATGILLIGLFAYVLQPRLRGLWRALLLLVPFFGYMTFWGILMPVAFAPLNMAMSQPLQYIIIILTLPLSLLIVRGAWEVTEFVRAHEDMTKALTARGSVVAEAT